MTFPEKNQFINIHSHRKAMEKNEWTLRNAFHILTPEAVNNLDYAVSIGMHPWMITDEWLQDLKELEQLFTLNNILAVGEAGIDKAIDISIDQQITVFEKQLELAVQFKKPFIIHAVRSYSDLVPYLKEYSSLKFILHDYRGNEQQTEELLKLPTVYFSFGKSLFRENSKEIPIFNSLPQNRTFLVTDNASLLISDVYQKAASLKNIEIRELKSEVFDTFARVFNL
jgi:TatD DNase family protein